MRGPGLSELPIVQIEGGFHAVVLRGWKSMLAEDTVKWMGRPLRPESADLWIVTSSPDDAATLAKLAQRDFRPEDVGASRERYVTVKRQPTFATALPFIPKDVACYFSGTNAVEDHALIQRLHPTPARVSERISWSGGNYTVRAGHGLYNATVGHAPTLFGAALAEVRSELLEKVGPGFDTTLQHLNASPILAGLLGSLTRPAAEAASHWLGRLGTGEIDGLTIPSRGLSTDLPVKSLRLESKGVNKHASFFLMVGSLCVTEMEVWGIELPETAAVGIARLAERGEMHLGQIIDLPGAELVPVLSMSRDNSSNSTWRVRIDPVSVPIEPPVSEVPFEADDEIARITDEGNQVGGDVMAVLRPLGRERASFILYCVEDGGSGMDFDVTPWMPEGTVAEVLLRNRSFEMSSTRRVAPTEFLKDIS